MTQTSSTPPPPTAVREALGFILTVVAGLLVALAVRILLFQPFTIPSSSMEPGLLVGDYIVVSKSAYGWSGASLPLGRADGPGRLGERAPRRGDVVVFRLPRDQSEVLIKRVVGLPGDEVRLRDGVVYLNGRSLEQRPAAAPSGREDGARQFTEVLPEGRAYPTLDRGPGRPGDDTPVFRVPAGRYLVLGDNRDNSLDGRWPSDIGVGLLPSETLIGRAEFVLASWRPGAGLFTPWTWLDLRWGRFLTPVV